jgi:hypothetical protein
MGMKQFSYIFFLLLSNAAFSQNNNSPFSLIGIGDIDNNGYNRTSGLASTGQAYRSERYLISNNPASLTALQKQFLHYELSGRGQFVTYTGDPLNGLSSKSKDFAMKHLTIGTKVASWWGTSIGLKPFSSSNYLLSTFKNIQGNSSSVPVQYDGNGGVNQVYWANGFQITRHFSVGINAAYLFGSLTQTETLSNSDLQTSLVTTRQLYLRHIYILYGAQYYTAINKKWDIALGGTYAGKTNINTQNNQQVTNNGVLIPNTNLQTLGNFTLPGAANFGIRIIKDKKYSFLADYQYQPWSSTNYSGPSYVLQNSNRYSIAVEKSNKKAIYQDTYEKSFLQAGLYYGNSYLNVNGHSINDMGLSLGFGSTSLKNPFGYAVSLEVGQRGTTSNGLIKENYVNINFTITHIDVLLTKGRKYQ